MQAVQIHNGFFLVFKRGEEVMTTLQQFCEEQEIHWAQFQGIGTVEDVEIGFYDLPNQEYVFRQEEGPFEVASLDGNVSEIDEAPVVHMHGVLSRCDASLECIGGHFKSARIAFTLEMCLWLVSQPLLRSRDEETGLNLITMSV